ncbi:restriction endonuclease [Paenibacillus sp. VTT E-133280]|uniref:BglII/BstYI family type II restriction endonuclease n=1 Tax=Paenibacillus sp. VTT E-133280 TaxID=1986222 RepID=UPI000BA12E7D|nr:BglII/BstYI family type II restriction endonuclease [Paenibacillus sp. VTT E-133280]OZQ67683.1 restriction endonuclease [Paenibacillus sp. VTT E-133280]
MKLTLHSHNFGSEAISEQVLNPLMKRLSEIQFEFRENSATDLRKLVLECLIELGWSDQVKVDRESNITITSMKNNVGLCLQLGNMARFYADILKLEVLHQKDTAVSAIYILPCKNAASKLGSNIAHFDRFTEELSIFKHIITIPIAVIGLESEDN